jgi:hypothetical protein
LAKVNDGANQFNPAAEILVILISGWNEFVVSLSLLPLPSQNKDTMILDRNWIAPEMDWKYRNRPKEFAAKLKGMSLTKGRKMLLLLLVNLESEFHLEGVGRVSFTSALARSKPLSWVQYSTSYSSGMWFQRVCVVLTRSVKCT